jgi:hypothetical protein
MLKKKLISLFLVLVFLIPVMPVMQVGSLLAQNQMTEEIVSHGTELGKFSGSDHSFIPGIDINESNEDRSGKHTLDESFTSRQADDIQTPPPNHTR